MRRALVRDRQRLVAVRRQVNGVPLEGQPSLHQAEHLRIVVDHQDAPRRHACLLLALPGYTDDAATAHVASTSTYRSLANAAHCPATRARIGSSDPLKASSAAWPCG